MNSIGRKSPGWDNFVLAWRGGGELSGDPESLLDQAMALMREGRLDEAETLFGSAPEEFLEHRDLAVTRAFCAQRRGDNETALARWIDVRARFADHPYSHAAISSLLLAKLDVEGAEAAIAPALVLFPSDPDVLANGLQIAMIRGDWDVAAERLHVLKTTAPNHPFTQTVASAMQETIARFVPANPLAAAEAAEKRSDWAQAQAQWRLIYEDDSSSRENLIRYMCASAQAHDLATADALFAVAMERFPNDLEIWGHHALAAGYCLDWAASADRWRAVYHRFPNAHIFCFPAAEALHQAGATAEGEDIINRAIRSDPTSYQYAISQAMFAQRIDKWDDAVRYWDALLKLTPEDTTLRELRGEAIWRAGLQNTENLQTAPRQAAAHMVPTEHGDIDMARLVLEFEGLGDNCEFGIVQRQFGAEPLGLLRFTAVKPATLIELLAEEFTRIGDPAHTVLIGTETKGYMLEDNRGLFHMHTFLSKSDVDHDKILAQQIKRINFLKRELIEDLRAGEKTFVFKDSEQAGGDNLLRTIADGLATYGKNLLLAVRLADAENPAGSTRLLTPGVMIGHIQTMFPMNGGQFDLVSWQQILEAAYRYKTTSFNAS